MALEILHLNYSMYDDQKYARVMAVTCEYSSFGQGPNAQSHTPDKHNEILESSNRSLAREVKRTQRRIHFCDLQDSLDKFSELPCTNENDDDVFNDPTSDHESLFLHDPVVAPSYWKRLQACPRIFYVKNRELCGDIDYAPPNLSSLCSLSTFFFAAMTMSTESHKSSKIAFPIVLSFSIVVSFSIVLRQR